MLGVAVILILHLLAILARAMEIVHISWIIILLPEIFCVLFSIVIFVIGFGGMVEEWRRRKQ